MTQRPGSRAGVPPLEGGRLWTFLGLCLVAAVLLEDPLTVAGATPDFLVVALVYGAVRWGAVGGAGFGFGLGLLRDILYMLDFGIHALGMTVLGYAVGKLRDTLYLSAPGVDVPLLFGTKLALDILVLGAAAGGAWKAFELRFFWEAPLSALYTTVVGAALYRAFAGARR